MREQMCAVLEPPTSHYITADQLLDSTGLCPEGLAELVHKRKVHTIITSDGNVLYCLPELWDIRKQTVDRRLWDRSVLNRICDRLGGLRLLCHGLTNQETSCFSTQLLKACECLLKRKVCAPEIRKKQVFSGTDLLQIDAYYSNWPCVLRLTGRVFYGKTHAL